MVTVNHTSQGNSATLRWLLYDGHGNLVRTMAPSYALSDWQFRWVWGEVQSNLALGRGYCANLGHPEDETGLVSMRARYYEPATGRFIISQKAFWRDTCEMNALPILCVLSGSTWVQADWSDIHPNLQGNRKLSACLWTIYQYDDEHGTPVPIRDWNLAKRNCLINVSSAHFTFEYLLGLLLKIVGNRQGLFVYSGSTSRVLEPDIGGEPVSLKMCSCLWTSTVYVASCTAEAPQLRGFPPGGAPTDYFYLGWLPQEDPIATILWQRWAEWSWAECEPFLPQGPSPSRYSVELTLFGEENDGLGLYLGEEFLDKVSPQWLRALLGEEAIIGELVRGDLSRWSVAGNMEDLRRLN